MILLDTHVLVWLYSGERNLLSTHAWKKLDRAPLFFSPIGALEVNYLYQCGKILVPANKLLGSLISEFGVVEADISFSEVCSEAAKLSWTRDPFDRLLVAHTLSAKAQLMTKDQIILKNCKKAFWV